MILNLLKRLKNIADSDEYGIWSTNIPNLHNFEGVKDIYLSNIKKQKDLLVLGHSFKYTIV